MPLPPLVLAPPACHPYPIAQVSFGGTMCGSLSTAGQAARRTVIGQDQRAQTNGWTFWRYRDEAGELRELDTLRRRLWESRTTR
jgi:hypothetical protein